MQRHTNSSLVTPKTRFLDACHRRQPDATPIWFMRQAGRCLAEYRELRKHYDILTMAKTPELCAQVTLMPVEQFGVDGAVLYADIMLPLEGMGISLEIQPEIGPIIHNPVRSMQVLMLCSFLIVGLVLWVLALTSVSFNLTREEFLKRSGAQALPLFILALVPPAS